MKEELKQALFAKIGRNVVLFQQLEMLLKHLISRSEISGTSSELLSKIEEREKKTFRKTMGQLAGDYVGDILAPVSDEPDFSKEPENLTEPWISFKFSFGDSEKFQAEMREHMADLVTQRNDLIHTLLPRLDLESEEKCEVLCAQLDKQADQIRNSVKHFQGVYKGFLKAVAEQASFMMSEEGKEMMFPAPGENGEQYDTVIEKFTFIDRPKLLGTKSAMRARSYQLEDPHVASLSDFVRRLRDKMGPDAAIPYFDPWDGGVEAEVLFLLEAPGPKARNSGFISMNNPDETAKNFFEISRDAGIDRKRTIAWNTVPWYIGEEHKIRTANTGDIEEGIKSLGELLQLLPRLRAIVLVGRKAEKAERHVSNIAPHLRVFRSPHPSPMFVNRKPQNRATLLQCWREVQTFLDD